MRVFTNIRKGKRPNDDEINLLLGNYLKIKQSPLQEITKKEVELLKDELGEEYSIYFANKILKTIYSRCYQNYGK